MNLIELVTAKNEDGQGSRSYLLYVGPRGVRGGENKSLWRWAPLMVLGAHHGYGDRWLEFTLYPFPNGKIGRSRELRLSAPLTRADVFVSGQLSPGMIVCLVGGGRRNFHLAESRRMWRDKIWEKLTCKPV